ncbi:hypothetical protein [Chitinimonas taiwanensis]|uniref:hypothetical protein n=1 Tax=Chitinimonas taiwanensis TaxID=240412 RepID=UPI001114E9FB|nr:hypothetical protein [Chitinimonas taiwanensis]
MFDIELLQLNGAELGLRLEGDSYSIGMMIKTGFSSIAGQFPSLSCIKWQPQLLKLYRSRLRTNQVCRWKSC